MRYPPRQTPGLRSDAEPFGLKASISRRGPCPTLRHSLQDAVGGHIGRMDRKSAVGTLPMRRARQLANRKPSCRRRGGNQSTIGPRLLSLPEDTPERIAEWAYGKEAKEREREELVGELSQAMRAHGHDPTPIRQAWGG